MEVEKLETVEKLRKIFDLPLVLTVEDVARVLGISRNQAYITVHKQGFPSFMVSKRHYRVRLDKLLDWMDSTGTQVKYRAEC